MISVTRLLSTRPDFLSRLDRLLQFDDATDASIEATVAGILADVKSRGDEAIVEYTNRFDRMNAKSMVEFTLPESRLDQALAGLEIGRREALEAAADRVRKYHERQLQASWSYTEEDGTMLGQQVTALDRVGLYVPGGKAAYPSSVLMNAIPAKVAGVKELIMVVPTPGGEQNDLVLAAAAIACVLYLVVFYRELTLRPGLPTFADILVSVVGVALLIEASRRAEGPWMPVISLSMLAYVFLGPYLPGLLSHKGASLGRAASHFWITSEGVFGVALGVSTTFIFLFVLFGALLYVSQSPTLFSRFTVMPMQIFGWSDRPGEAWQYNAAMASTVLVVTLLAMNALAIYLRHHFQRYTRW